MQLVIRIIVAILAVWLIITYLLPFLFGMVALPSAVVELVKIAVILGALWFVWKGGYGL